MALKGFGAQVGDAVALQVLSSGERLSTALLRTDKSTVIVMFPDKNHADSHYHFIRQGDGTALFTSEEALTVCDGAAWTCWWMTNRSPPSRTQRAFHLRKQPHGNHDDMLKVSSVWIVFLDTSQIRFGRWKFLHPFAFSVVTFLFIFAEMNDNTFWLLKLSANIPGFSDHFHRFLIAFILIENFESTVRTGQSTKCFMSLEFGL